MTAPHGESAAGAAMAGAQRINRLRDLTREQRLLALEHLAGIVPADVDQVLGIVAPEDDRLLTTEQVAAMTGMHTETVHRWRRAGKLPSEKDGMDRHRFRESVVRALLNGGQR